MKYDYGDDLIFHGYDANGNVVEKPCTVVGITVVENPRLAETLQRRLGAVL